MACSKHLRSLLFCLTLVFLWAPHSSMAQGLDESLDAELDELPPEDPEFKAEDVNDEDSLAAELGDEAPGVKAKSASQQKAPPAAGTAKAAPAPQVNPTPTAQAKIAPAATPAPQAAAPQPAPESEDIVEDMPAPSEELAPAPEQKVAPAKPEPQFEPEPETIAPSEPAFASGGENNGGSGTDAPNVALERRLHKMFQRSGAPVADDDWAKMITNIRQDYYAVQAGDTLWDISSTFFGDGFFWSKLWAENRSIENPHRISPGKALRFIAGTEAEAPSMSVTEASLIPKVSGDSMALQSLSDLDVPPPVYSEQAKKMVSEEDIAKGDVEESELLPAPEIPEASPNSPSLRHLPPSFVNTRVSSRGMFDSTGLDVGKRKAITDPAVVIPNSIMADESPAHVGTVEEIELGEDVASLGQAVFVKLARGAKKGDKFSVLYPKGSIPANRVLNVGPVIEVGGVIEVVETVNEGKGFYKAMVTLAVSPIRVGSIVTDEPLPRIKFDSNGRRNSTVARVIGGEFDEQRKLLGQSAVIYLDAGTDSGINAGDVLAIQARRGEHRVGSKIPDWDKPIGVVKVVKAFKSVATAIVIKSNEEIIPGDRTGANFPTALPKLKTEKLDAVPAQATSNKDGTEEIDF